ncbi:MAG TPA: hypothetical protein VIE43_12935 [Thermoanaerobaculia bacterium]|nr:hypothetical protein [Thermoanaerobaculia bacterium]
MKKLILSRETLSRLENLEGVVGGATVLCTATQAQTCKTCPTTFPPCYSKGC